MDNKRILLHDYLDDALPVDIRAQLEHNLQNNPELQSLLELERAKRTALAEAGSTFRQETSLLTDLAKARVLERLGTRARPKHVPFWKSAFTIPVPLLAAMGLVFVGVLALSFALRSPNQNQGGIDLASVNQGTADGLPVVSSPFTFESKGVELTIQLSDLNQLLSILEGGTGSREVRVSLPQNLQLEPVGEPMLINASERR